MFRRGGQARGIIISSSTREEEEIEGAVETGDKKVARNDCSLNRSPG